METITIKTKINTEVGQVAELELSVLKKFMENGIDVATVEEVGSKYDPVELLSKFKLAEYIHNTKGPAMIISFGGHQYKEYWINGEMIQDKEMIKKIEHEGQFQDKFDKVLED